MKYPAQSDLWMLEHATRNRQQTNLKSSLVLARFRQFFPLTIFKDELIIEDDRVIFIDNKGPWMKDVISIMATDIASVNSSTGPFWGHIHIKSLTGGPEIMIDRLWNHDIHKIRSYVEGIALISRRDTQLETSNIEARRQILFNKGAIH